MDIKLVTDFIQCNFKGGFPINLIEMQDYIDRESKKFTKHCIEMMTTRLIEEKMTELFGAIPDQKKYFDNLIATKKGIERGKLNALRDYIKALTLIEEQAKADVNLD